LNRLSLDSASLNEVELSEYCRRKGLYPEQIHGWRNQLSRMRRSREGWRARRRGAVAFFGPSGPPWLLRGGIRPHTDNDSTHLFHTLFFDLLVADVLNDRLLIQTDGAHTVAPRPEIHPG
jgi:hypothetical protein